MNVFDLERARNGDAVCMTDGREVKIVAFDARVNNRPATVLGLASFDDNYDLIPFSETGKSLDGGHHLCMVPKKYTGWLNRYSGTPGGFCYLHEDKEEADHLAGAHRVDCIKIHWEE